jgi:hypothetical protein
VIEQIGNDDEENGDAARQTRIGYRGGKVRFATTESTFEQQPAARIFGERARSVVRIAQVLAFVWWQANAIGTKRLEGHLREMPQAALLPQIFQTRLLCLANFAFARNRTTKVGMIHRHIAAKESNAATDGAYRTFSV